MNQCQDIQAELSAYLDDELSAAQREVVTGHLDDCAGCAAVLNELRQVQGAFAAVPKLTAPPGFCQNVQQRIALPPESAVVAPLTATRSPWLPVYFAVAAMLMLSLLVFLVLPRMAPEGQGTAMLKEAPRVSVAPAVDRSRAPVELKPAPAPPAAPAPLLAEEKTLRDLPAASEAQSAPSGLTGNKGAEGVAPALRQDSSETVRHKEKAARQEHEQHRGPPHVDDAAAAAADYKASAVPPELAPKHSDQPQADLLERKPATTSAPLAPAAAQPALAPEQTVEADHAAKAPKFVEAAEGAAAFGDKEDGRNADAGSATRSTHEPGWGGRTKQDEKKQALSSPSDPVVGLRSEVPERAPAVGGQPREALVQAAESKVEDKSLARRDLVAHETEKGKAEVALQGQRKDLDEDRATVLLERARGSGARAPIVLSVRTRDLPRTLDSLQKIARSAEGKLAQESADKKRESLAPPAEDSAPKKLAEKRTGSGTVVLYALEVPTARYAEVAAALALVTHAPEAKAGEGKLKKELPKDMKAKPESPITANSASTIREEAAPTVTIVIRIETLDD